MAKAMQLAIGIILLLTVVIAEDHPLCHKFIGKLEKCLAKGYTATLLNNCASGEGSLEQKKIDKCQKMESKVVKKCSYQCESVQPTDVNGAWSDYGGWTECSETCGGGSQTQSRTCTNPAPANGGANCLGQSSQSQSCNTDACITPATPQTVITAVWQQIPGKLTRISKGKSGVWGVNSAGNIYQLDTDGNSWTQISGGLVQVSSGASVWGVNGDDQIYKYLGNNDWQHITGGLTNVDVSNNDHVWGINEHQDIYRRSGDSWQQIEGKAIQVTVGESGVWVVNSDNNIYYRTGTYGDPDTAGSDWVKVSGKLKWVGSGKNIVVGVNADDDIYYRSGLSAANPTGTGWIKVSGKLRQIDVHEDEVVGTNSNDDIYRSPVILAK